jgi:pyridoxamine 5'-phosphate oxidase family protein
MSRFTEAEVNFLLAQKYGRLATLSRNGDLHVVPNRFRYNPETDTLDLGGHTLTDTKKYRDGLRYGRVAFVVDDFAPEGYPRFVEVRGTVAAVAEGGELINPKFPPAILRLTPIYIVSIGLNDDVVQPGQNNVNYSGRKVG